MDFGLIQSQLINIDLQVVQQLHNKWT